MESSDLIQLKDVLDICKNYVAVLEIKLPAGFTAHSSQMSHFVAANYARVTGSKLFFGVKDSSEVPIREVAEDQVLRWMLTVPEIYGADTTSPMSSRAISGIDRYIYNNPARQESVQKKSTGAANVKVYENIEEAQHSIFGCRTTIHRQVDEVD